MISLPTPLARMAEWLMHRICNADCVGSIPTPGSIRKRIMPICVDCGINLNDSNANRRRSKRYSGKTFQSRCKKCACNWVKMHRKQHQYQRLERHIERKYYLQKVYGITQHDYDRMLRIQNDCCAICTKRLKLFIDHDHSSNVIRGLLCNKCNSLIGYADEDVRILQNAILYINKHKHKKTALNLFKF